MAESFHIFSYKFNDEELEQNFNDFFNIYNLTPIFTNEHRASPISVSYIDAKSVVNTTGKYHNVLKNFSDYVNSAMDNKMYESALFKMIYQANSFQGLINIVTKIMKHIQNDIDNKHLFNTWNIVWYTKEVY